MATDVYYDNQKFLTIEQQKDLKVKEMITLVE